MGDSGGFYFCFAFFLTLFSCRNQNLYGMKKVLTVCLMGAMALSFAGGFSENSPGNTNRGNTPQSVLRPGGGPIIVLPLPVVSEK